VLVCSTVKFTITNILLLADDGVIEAEKPRVTKLPDVIVEVVVLVALTT
jgi:hypothetical protein